MQRISKAGSNELLIVDASPLAATTFMEICAWLSKSSNIRAVDGKVEGEKVALVAINAEPTLRCGASKSASWSHWRHALMNGSRVKTRKATTITHVQREYNRL